MSATVVTTQAELDAALADPAVDEIEIRSERGVWLTIGDTGNSHVTVAGEATISQCSGSVGEVTGSGRVGWVTGSGRVGEVTGSGSVGRVTGSGRVGEVTDLGRVGEVTDLGRVGEVTGSGSVGRVTGSGSVGEVTDSGRVGEVTGSGSVGEVTDSGRVGRVTGSGSVGWVTGSGRVGEVTDSGRVGEVTDSGRVGRVTGSGSVGWVTGSGRVGRVTDSGRVERAAGTSTVHLYGAAQLLKASPHVAVFLHSARATVEGGHLIDLTDLDLTDPATWGSYHGVEVDVEDGIALLYKAVRQDWRSAHGTSYEPGTTASCDDFRADGDCGHGLHVSPTPAQAAAYDHQATRYVEVHVPLAEVNIIGPDKCKAASVTCVREVDIHGRPILAEAPA